MTAGVYENKCVVVRVPAWHRLGYVAPEPLDAREAVVHLGGLPKLVKRRLSWPDGSPSPWYGLGRINGADRVEEGFAAVSADYRMVTLDEFVEAWELGTDNAKIETMAVLNGGKIFFITTPLPETDIAGDAVKRYLSVANFNDGGTANVGQIADIRWVCQNTLMASLDQGQSIFRVAHDTDVMANLIAWMRDCYQTALAKAAAVKAALELMAARTLTDAEAWGAVTTALPLPREPQSTGSARFDLRRYENWERVTTRLAVERRTVLATFGGDGQGMETRAARGTAFGMYNALAETYEYIIPSTNEKIQARSFLFGDRRTVVQRGFDHLLELSRN